MATRIDQLSRTTMNAFIQDTREHGIFNTKFTAVNNSTTEQSMGIDLSSSSYDINCAVRKAGSTGDVEWLSSASAIKITMPTGTWSAQIAGITITGAYDFYKYVVSDNGTIRTMISRSPYHKSVPANYYHTISATGMTAVGSPSTAWDAAFLSGSGTVNATNACVCLGLIGTITINGTTGVASASTLATGASPLWDSTPDLNPQPFPSVAAGTLLTATTTAPSYGTVTQNVGWWWLSNNGKMFNFIWDYAQSTAGGSGSGTYLFNLFFGFQADTTKFAVNTNVNLSALVDFTAADTSNGYQSTGRGCLYSATQIAVRILEGTAPSTVIGNALWGSANRPFGVAVISYTLKGRIPLA